jgi:hypothetical protein
MQLWKISSELGLRDMDINFDWAGDIRQRYAHINLADSSNFIQNARNLYVAGNDNVTDRVIDCNTCTPFLCARLVA